MKLEHQEFNKDNIIAHGILNEEDKDTLFIDWILTKGCNYNCSYCINKDINKLEEFSLENIFLTAKKILSLNRNRYIIKFKGGEPTLYPFLPNLIKYIFNNKQNINLILKTNISRKIDYYKYLLQQIPPFTTYIELSIHLEYSKYSHIEDIIKLINFYDQHCIVNIYYLPDAPSNLATKAYFLYNKLESLKEQFPFILNIKNFFQNELNSKNNFNNIKWIKNYHSKNLNKSLNNWIDIYYKTKDNTLSLKKDLSLDKNISYNNFFTCMGINYIKIYPDYSISNGENKILLNEENIENYYISQIDDTKFIKDSINFLPKFFYKEDAQKWLKNFLERNQNTLKNNLPYEEKDDHIKKEFYKIENTKTPYEILDLIRNENLVSSSCEVEKNKEKKINLFLRRSGLFDIQWYLEKNNDVKLSGMDPILHYIRYGEKEGRKPNSWFDINFISKINNLFYKDINIFYQFISKEIENNSYINYNSKIDPNNYSIHDYITDHNIKNKVESILINEGFNFWIEEVTIPNIIRYGIKIEVKNSVIGYLKKGNYGIYKIDIIEIKNNLYEFIIVNNDTLLCSPKIQINFWQKNSSYIFSTNENSLCKRIPIQYREKTIYSMNLPWLRKDHKKNLYMKERLKLSPNIEFSYDFPVDIVYTWVNGQDKNWIKNKNNYQPKIIHNLDDNKIRYRDNNELKYSLRSIASFFKDFRKIFIITDNQRPKFINNEDERIIFIDHSSIVPNKYLPLYNSNAIESCLHNIHDLSEFFLYFNDDYMLGAPCNKEDFFFSNGLIKCFLASEGFFYDKDDNEEACANAAHYNAKNFSKLYNKTLYTRNAHIAQGFRKSILSLMEKEFKQEFLTTLSNRFRSENDFITTAYAFNFFTILKGFGVPVHLDNEVLITNRASKTLKEELAIIQEKKKKFFCINDAVVSPSLDYYVDSFYNRMFPIPASWELQNKWF